MFIRILFIRITRLKIAKKLKESRNPISRKFSSNIDLVFFLNNQEDAKITWHLFSKYVFISVIFYRALSIIRVHPDKGKWPNFIWRKISDNSIDLAAPRLRRDVCMDEIGTEKKSEKRGRPWWKYSNKYLTSTIQNINKKQIKLDKHIFSRWTNAKHVWSTFKDIEDFRSNGGISSTVWWIYLKVCWLLQVGLVKICLYYERTQSHCDGSKVVKNHAFLHKFPSEWIAWKLPKPTFKICIKTNKYISVTTGYQK